MNIKNYPLQLTSANGNETVNVEWSSLETDDNDIIKISLELHGEKIELSDECTEVLLIKLSKMLQGKYTICSCFTCRHGNYCPIGDMDNEIFCVNDFEPKCKEDIYFVTEDAKEREKRSRTLFDICLDFKPCTKGYFTYK